VEQDSSNVAVTQLTTRALLRTGRVLGKQHRKLPDINT
jgi:hypothetical protein